MNALGRLFSITLTVCCTALPLYSATHLEVLDAIKQEWNSLPGIDVNADNQALLAFVQGIPEFSDSGLDTRCSCVWAVFSDGPLVVLANNSKEQGPPPPASVAEGPSVDWPSGPQSQLPTLLEEAAPADLSPSEVPNGQFAVLMNARGADMPNPIPDLRSWLSAQGYSDSSVLCNDASVACLRQGPVGPDVAVYYLNTYGGLLERAAGGPKHYILATSTVVNPTTWTDPDIRADWGAGRVDYCAHKHYLDPGTQRWAVENFFCINADFIRYYWKNKEFAQNSFVFIDACLSNSEDFKQAIFASKASVYAGWSDEVSTDKSPVVAKFFFDRLLGANQVAPEADGFKQRAFDYIQAGGSFDPFPDSFYHDMQDQNPTSQVIFTSNPAQTQTSFGLLAPSIMFEAPFELDIPGFLYRGGTLVITGTFGSDPGPDPDSKVTVGGLNCPVQTNGWQPDQIQCDLPSGAAGDVVVTVRKHQSNKARLSKWNPTFRYRVQGDGSLQASITYRVAFRADIRKVRGVIHDPPIGPNLLLTASHIPDESSATYACSGTAVETTSAGTTTITWTGSGNVPGTRARPNPAGTFDMGLENTTGPVNINIYHGPGPGCDWTRVFVTSDGMEFSSSGHWDLDVRPFDIGAMPIEPNDPSFPAGSRDLSAFCTNTPPTFTTPQCRMEWDAIPAMFPPDPNSPR